MYKYKSLYDNHPNLKIITLIRNPITHIPSILKLTSTVCMWSLREEVCNSSIAKYVDEICYKQLDKIKYAKLNWSKYRFNVF